MSEVRSCHVPQEPREAADVRQVQVADVGSSQGPAPTRQTLSFHCRAYNYFLVDTQAASFGGRR